MATDTYVYPGEPLESDQIRLIRVRPGAWNDPIVCDLYNTRHTSFDDRPIPYYTLSYVWGSRGASREVILSGRPCRVTVNLERALRYYRHHYPYGADLWADALCIDQTNVTERTHQVRLMGQIYSKCKKMVIYLGDRLEYSKKEGIEYEHKFGTASGSDVEKRRCGARPAIQLIREMSSNSHLSEIRSFQSQEDLEYTMESLRRLVHAPFTPWWDRVWVVQEAALAPDIDVMQGLHVLPWLDFAHAALNLERHSISCCSEYLAGLPRDCVKVIWDFTRRVLAVHNSRSSMQAMSLPSLLSSFRDRKATDPRDKVYALLSLTTSNIVPDYSISEVEVFCTATEKCIVSSQNLSILNNDLGKKWRQDLPSWVPDWGSPSSPFMDTRAKIAAMCYNTCPGFSAEAIRMSDKKLQVRGRYIRRICKIGDIMWGETDNSIKETLSQWWSVFPRRLRKTFWRTVCGDVIASEVGTPFRRGSPVDEKTFAAWALVSDQSPYRLHRKKGDQELRRVKEIAERLERDEYDPSKTHQIYDSLERLDLLEQKDRLGIYRFKEYDTLDLYRVETYDPLQVVDLHGKSESLEPPTAKLGARLEFRDKLKQLEAHEMLPWHLAFPILSSHNIETASSETQHNVPDFERSVGIATLFRRLIIFGRYTEGINMWYRHKLHSMKKPVPRMCDWEHGPTEKVGLGPSEARVGDRLFIIEGAKTPLILRPDHSFNKHYKVIGDCYADGLMDDWAEGIDVFDESDKIWLI